MEFKFLPNLYNPILKTIDLFAVNTRLFTQTGQYYHDTGIGISREDYKNGCALFVFDLTPQLESSDASFELIKNGNIRIEIHFTAALTETITVIIFAEHDNLLEIDENRSVAFDYTA